jgi:transposase
MGCCVVVNAGLRKSAHCVPCGATATANRAAQALRMAAQALRKSQTALGAHHRRLCSRMDKPKAITVSAHKLARLVYFMLTKGQAFVEAGQDEYEERYRQRVVQNLTRRAHQLGFQLTPQETSSV